MQPLRCERLTFSTKRAPAAKVTELVALYLPVGERGRPARGEKFRINALAPPNEKDCEAVVTTLLVRVST